MNLTPDIIHSPTGNNVHDFGSSVAVDGQTVLVGCSQYTSVDGARVGRTFFYEYNSKNGAFSDFSDDGSTSGGTVTLSGSLGMSKALGNVSFNYFQKVNGRWELTQTYRENTSGYYFKTGCSPSGFGASNSMSDHYFIAGYNTAGGTMSVRMSVRMVQVKPLYTNTMAACGKNKHLLLEMIVSMMITLVTTLICIKNMRLLQLQDMPAVLYTFLSEITNHGHNNKKLWQMPILHTSAVLQRFTIIILSPVV
jgi:hypothetical protein